MKIIKIQQKQQKTKHKSIVYKYHYLQITIRSIAAFKFDLVLD